MKKLGKMSFQMQLTVSFLGCLFVSVIIILGCLILNIRETEQNSQRDIERQDEQWAAELDFMMAAIDKMRFLHLADDEVKRIVMGSEDRGQDIKIADEQYMGRLLDVLCTTNSDVLRITVVTSSGDIYGNYVEDSETSVALAKEHLLYENRNNISGMSVTDVYEGTINLVPYSLLTFQYPLYELTRGESLGTVYVDMNFGAMRERFDALEYQEGWSKYILNGKGVIYASDQELGTEIGAKEQEKIREFAENGGGTGRLEIGGETYAVYVKYLESLDWWLVQCVRRSSFISGEMRRIYLLAFWIILLLCGQICAGTLVIRQISAPIKAMSHVMSQAATKERKEFKYMECREEYPKEVREIALGYNAMIGRIHENIIREYENELIKKKTELQMLQYQINPHFLYNTLNIMSSIARLHEIPYIPDISESLSGIFFYNVKGGQVASLQEELDNLQNYIRIQRIRFPEKFEVSYEIEETLRDCRILKFLMQPLVENAINHGIAGKRRKGKILIRAKRIDEEEAEIVIEDDGMGIPPEKLESLQDMLREKEAENREEVGDGIGIRNVQMRIRNYYGPPYGIILESREGCGTKIRIILPVSGEEE